MSNLRKSILSRGTKRFSSGTCNDCTPVNWSKYFENQQEVRVRGNTFHVYLTGNTGPLLLMIHGGGYSSLTWSLFTEEITNKIECQILAVDLRGHGNTKTDDEENLSLEVLASDITDVVNAFFHNGIIPPIVLIGHSLGGAVAVAAASLIPEVVGLCVIDVVEGTALESLSSMQSILRGRPSSFKSIEHAIQWSFRGGQTHNLEAARVSMPGQIKNIQTDSLAANECDNIVADENNSVQPQEKPQLRLVHQRSADAIEEENEDEHNEQTETSSEDSNSEDLSNESDQAETVKDCGKPPIPNASGNAAMVFKVPETETNLYTWRIDLSKTEPFWNGWFKGLSQKFLDVQVPKVLLLANIHGLDTTLTVGQMQGKFQLQVLPRSGHAIHEDQPHHVADIIAGFLVKQRLAISRNGFTPSMPAC